MELCDVTLREGDQMPGRNYDVGDKIAAGRELADLGVPYVQAGFPVTGEKDRDVIGTLAAETDARIVGLARATPHDVEAALDADADVVEVFAPLATNQLEYMVGRTRDEMLASLRDAVDAARDAGVETHVALVDAFRTEKTHLLTAFEQFPDVEYVTLADTVGARTPVSVREFLDDLGDDVDLSSVGVHFHDDLGVATANAQAAYEMGVGRIDVSINSLGERAGNAALEELVAIGDLEYGDTFGIDKSKLIPACENALEHLGESIHPRAALLGEEVTTHESGLHTAAMLDEPSVFEAFDPARFGGGRTLVFGTGTGTGAARKILERAAIEPTDERLEEFLTALAEEGPMNTGDAKSLAVELFDGS